jgi:hypothetical protein
MAHDENYSSRRSIEYVSRSPDGPLSGDDAYCYGFVDSFRRCAKLGLGSLMNNDLLHYWIGEARYNYTQFMQNLHSNPLGVARSTVSSHLYDWGWRPIPHQGHDRTAYIMGLSGTGRWYVNEMIMQNIGIRAKCFRDAIRIHPGPTSMVYSGHATIKYVCRNQEVPAVTRRIFESVRSRFADLIFIYRHPLDTLLSSWVWWRTYVGDGKLIYGISDVYKNRDGLSADLEQNFSEFELFAAGDPNFFAAVPHPRFLAAVPGQRLLSFPEFVEETELYLQSATLALRLEDFIVDPVKEFSKLVEVMSVDLDVSRLSIARPRTKPYGYLAVKEKVPRFRKFINELNAETKRRIEKSGYDVSM